MPLPSLDDQICKDILPTFLIAREPFRFNGLYRFLNEGGFKISKPTLSMHLKHLEEKELIIRKEVDKQNVIYYYNRKKWGSLDEIKERGTEVFKFLEEEKENFFKASPREQVFNVNMTLLLQGLYQLKFEMLKIMEPEKAFQHHLETSVYGNAWGYFKRWLLESFEKNNDKYRKEVLESIEKMIDQYVNITFETENKQDSISKG